MMKVKSIISILWAGEHTALGEVLETAINRNEVTIIGKIHGNTIDAKSFKAPPPPKKSIFKGCL